MKRTPFKPGGGLSRPGGLKGGGSKTPPSPFEAQREAAKRAALNALKRARRSAEKAGVSLSEWEGEFLGSVEERVKTYGRAFGDPEKGGRDQALSVNQTIKLKEIAAKAKGEKTPMKRGKGFGRRAPPPPATPDPED